MSSILLVEDDFALRLSLTTLLENSEHLVEAVASAEEAESYYNKNSPDIVILDWNLPGTPGISLLEKWRDSGETIPVIMLTARDKIEDRVLGLETGADDYLVKPFATDELLARIDVQLRRLSPNSEQPLEPFKIGNAIVNVLRNELKINNKTVSLTEQESQTLAYLFKHKNKNVPRSDLLKEVWGFRNGGIRTRAVDNAIYRLRGKLEADPIKPEYLISVHGVGYRLESH